jgi:hypothetical protein
MKGMEAERNQALFEQFDRLIVEAGGDPGTLSGKVVREMLHTAIKLIHDEADEGELKLISRSMKELRYALKVFRAYRHVPKVSIFGSARTAETHPQYRAAVQFSRAMAAAGWMVITGAGDGIMRAGHGGAGRAASFGVAIRLPYETNANEYIFGDQKLVTFRYFFTRKLIFMWQAQAVVLFPGGFGTQDEGFEALTLIQTGKAPLVPIVMIDEPGGKYWEQWQRYVDDALMRPGLIGAEDRHLYFMTDDPAVAARHVLDFYRNYHSQRFVHDVLVIRMRRPLTAEQVQWLNEEFSALVAEAAIEQGGPREGESDWLELPRVYFTFTRRGYGVLRLFIDRINEFDAVNGQRT